MSTKNVNLFTLERIEMFHHKTAEMSWAEWIDRNFVLILGQVAGLVLLLAGAASIALFGWLANIILSKGIPDNFALVFLCVLALLSCFGIVVGYRMLFLKPNKSGSILGAFGWWGMGLFWGSISLLMLWIDQSLDNLHLSIAAGAACVWSCFRARGNAKVSSNAL